MGKIVQRFQYKGDRGKALVETLMDSGASVSIMRRDVAQKLAAHFLVLAPRMLRKVDGRRWTQVREVVTLEVKMKGLSLDFKFYVVDEMPREAIVGVDFMQAWEMKLDPKHHDFTIGVDPNAIEMA